MRRAWQNLQWGNLMQIRRIQYCMIKATFKSVAVALSFIAIMLLVLGVIDGRQNPTSAQPRTCIKVTVLDLDDQPVHNAEVTVGGRSFFTDNKGASPAIELNELANSYDSSITDWGTVTVAVRKQSYTPAFVFNCVVFASDTRRLTVRLYPRDGSDLPYVSYVESPPDSYIRQLLSGAQVD